MQVHDSHVRTLLNGAQAACAETRERLFSVLYHELHRIAERQLRRSGSNALSPTTVLHETFLSLANRDGLGFDSRAQFMSYAARVMRGLIIDYCRSRRAQKRGSGFELTSLPTEPSMPPYDVQSDQLSDTLDELAHIDSHLAECVDLHFFCGFSFEEIAALWQVSLRTVRRDWTRHAFC
jgi:RNA polymerase sigma factor (TIGR02999 family)